MFLGGQTSQLAERLLAGGRGVEPRLTDPESAVLPLNYPPVRQRFYHRREGEGRPGPVQSARQSFGWLTTPAGWKRARPIGDRRQG